jgi:hypothetical protein
MDRAREAVMTESSWVLKGVDPELREKAAAEAERLGVSLGDYLTNMVLKSAITDQFNALAEAESSPVEAEERAIFAPPPESSEGFAVRQRLKALERRLSTAISGLDTAVHGVDSSVFDLTARVGDVEALAGDTAEALGHTQHEINNTITGVQIHLAVIEDNISSLAHVQDQRSTGIEERLDGVAHVANAATRQAAVLADTHEALKHAVAGDFVHFARETTDRLTLGLAEVRAAADIAAEQADAAVSHLIEELRAVREAMDDRLSQSAAETRARMHVAFSEAADRMSSLTDRVVENERFTARVTEQLRAQIADVEDGAQSALEETAYALRAADSALAADISRAAQENYAALENTRAEITALREDQLSQLARLKLADNAIGNVINDLAEVREATDRGIADVRDMLLQRVRDAQAASATRADAQERDATQLRQTLLVEIERVETCSFAALEKLGRDIAEGGANAENRIELAAQSFRIELTGVRAQAAADINTLREDHTGALARLTLLDGALARVESAAAPLEARIAELERATASTETNQALGSVRDDLAALVQRFNASAADTTLADRIGALYAQLQVQDAASSDLHEKLQGLARMLNRVAAQNVENSSKADERAHQIDVAMADIRLSQLAAAPTGAPEEAIRAFEQRVDALEQRQVDALHSLRNDIARFVADNDRRLGDLEEPKSADTRDLAGEFEALRARIEERIIGVETRSIRTLEQVTDTVALIEQRFLATGGDEKAARSA